MTTVGYGDFTPATVLGKMVAVATALWGGFIIFLVIASVNSLFSLSEPEKMAFDKLVKIRSAVDCITSAFRYRVKQKKLNKMVEKNSF